MSVTPPEAKVEYSRAPMRSPRPRGISLALLGGGVVGALLLLVAEFTPLYDEDSAASRIPLRTVQTGSHHAYALIPIGLLALVLAIGVWRSAGGRAGLVALGALGVVAIVIALVVDLPDAQASGVVGNPVAGYTKAKDVPGVGLYLETLGAALLVIAGGAGLLLAGAKTAYDNS